jgi:IMP dehydrogenase/GMP reductase
MITRSSTFRMGLSYDDVLLIPALTRATSRKLVDVSTTITPRIKTQIPIVSANTPFCTESGMASAIATLGGLGVLHRMCTIEREMEEVRRVKAVRFSPGECPNATVDRTGRLQVGAAVGVKGDFLKRAAGLVRAGADLLVVDIAHCHADFALEAIHLIKTRYGEDIDIMAGNVATSAGTRDLIEAGADAVKVGIGPGSICTTRLVTGAGVPQITALVDSIQIARATHTPVIADGGIRQAGDITKALAVGASAVMLGGLLAGTDESAAIEVQRNGKKCKMTTGFASVGVDLTLKRASGEEVTAEELEDYVPEGVEAVFVYQGPLNSVLRQLVGGLRSGMSYGGALNIPELQERAEFIQVSPAGFVEGTPHALQREPAPQLQDVTRETET